MASEESVESAEANPQTCSECGSTETEFVEAETTLTGALIRRFCCNDCYAGYEVEYAAVSKETYHEPETPSRSEA